MKLELRCEECGTSSTHLLDGEDAACLSCGAVRTVEAELLNAVIDVEYCNSCRARLPVGHECGSDPTECLRKTGLWPCGTCDACLAAQAKDLAHRADLIEHGSPNDLYTP